MKMEPSQSHLLSADPSASSSGGELANAQAAQSQQAVDMRSFHEPSPTGTCVDPLEGAAAAAAQPLVNSEAHQLAEEPEDEEAMEGGSQGVTAEIMAERLRADIAKKCEPLHREGFNVGQGRHAD